MRTLRVWTGPVHSGKSKRAMALARRMVRTGRDLVLVRPEQSIRDYEEPGWLVTKDGEKWPSIDVKHPQEILAACRDAKVLWLDEPMLFDENEEPEVFPLVQEVRREMPVLVSGLSATSELEVFRISMSMIIAVADKVFWCTADCDECKKIDVATRSSYIGREKKHGQVKKGGQSDYDALCPGCWNRRTKQRIAQVIKGDARSYTEAAQIEA